MKYIKIPSAILLRDPLTDRPLKVLDPDTNQAQEKYLSFGEFLISGPLSDDTHFGKNLDQIDLCVRIRKQVREATGVIALERDEYIALLNAVKEPSKGYSTNIMCQCMAFFDAVRNASDKLPDTTDVQPS